MLLRLVMLLVVGPPASPAAAADDDNHHHHPAQRITHGRSVAVSSHHRPLLRHHHDSSHRWRGVHFLRVVVRRLVAAPRRLICCRTVPIIPLPPHPGPPDSSCLCNDVTEFAAVSEPLLLPHRTPHADCRRVSHHEVVCELQREKEGGKWMWSDVRERSWGETTSHTSGAHLDSPVSQASGSRADSAPVYV